MKQARCNADLMFADKEMDIVCPGQLKKLYKYLRVSCLYLSKDPFFFILYLKQVEIPFSTKLIFWFPKISKIISIIYLK